MAVAVRHAARAQADRVDVDLGLARQLEHLVVADQGRRVLAVGEQHDGAAPQLGRLLLLRQVLERHVERVVQRGGARGLGAADRRPRARAWSAVKSCSDRGAVVELHHLREVLRPQRPHEARWRPAARRGSFSSMEAEVSIIRTSEMGRSSWVKIDSSCLTPSSKTAKSVVCEVGDVAAAGVGDGHVEVDDLDAGLERRGRGVAAAEACGAASSRAAGRARGAASCAEGRGGLPGVVLIGRAVADPATFAPGRATSTSSSCSLRPAPVA